MLAVLSEGKPALVTVIAVKRRNSFLLKPHAAAVSEESPLNEPKFRQVSAVRTGAGMCLSAEGLIVTNAHVIERADRLFIRFQDGRTFAAKPRRLMKNIDLALVSVEDDSSSGSFPFVPIDERPLHLGQEVFTLGHSPLLSGTVSAGAVVGLGRASTDPSSFRVVFVLLDFEHYPGDSGGPVFNRNGALVALLSRRERGGRHRVLALPVSFIKDLIDRKHNTRTFLPAPPTEP